MVRSRGRDGSIIRFREKKVRVRPTASTRKRTEQACASIFVMQERPSEQQFVEQQHVKENHIEQEHTKDQHLV